MVDHMENFELSPPLDLSHHYSDITKHRAPSAIKGFYKYFAIPGIGNLAGGLPNPGYFPFDTLEASSALPNRFKPSPVSSTSASQPAKGAASQTKENATSDAQKTGHLVVPHDSSLPNKLARIDLSTALQYGTAQGYPPLASFLRTFTLNHFHPNIPYKGGADITLTNGNTDGFSKAIECFTNPWFESSGKPLSERQGLLVERYVYMTAVQTAQPRGLNIVPVAVDGEGMVAYGDEKCLYNVLNGWDVERDGGKRPHIMYTVTMGQNPTSGLLSVKRRKEIYGICQKFDILIVEDDPYFYIQFPHVANELTQKWRGGEVASMNHFAEQGTNYQTGLAVPVRGTVSCGDLTYPTTRMRHGVSSGYEFLDSLVPSYLSFDVDGRVIRLDTFSKTVAPGCRLGWITAQPDMIDKLLRISEVSTQQPSGFTQAIVAELLIGPDHKAQYDAARKNSRKKGEVFFDGWKTDGWVRWLEGLRGNYERRMRIMAEVFEAGKFTTMSSKVSASDEKRMKVVIKTTPRSHINQASSTCSHLRKASSPKNTTTTSDSETADDFEILTQSQLYDFTVPMAGMFFWLRFDFSIHPLTKKFSLPELSRAFWVFQTREPHLILSAPGTLFAPTPGIELEDAWQYFRICFAAVDEAEVQALSERLVKAAHDFWDVTDVDEIQGLLDEGTEEVEGRMREGLLGAVPFAC